MSQAVLLEHIEGYRPLATVDSLDSYFMVQGADELSEQANVHGLPIDASQVAEVVARVRSERQEQQSASAVATAVAHLSAERLRACGGRLLCLDGLRSTHLADVFMNQYDVDVGQLTDNSRKAMRLCVGMLSQSDGEGVYVNYQVEEARYANRFWQLILNATYGFANMYCSESSTPLRGEGNVAYVPGALEAVAQDVSTVFNKHESQQ